MLRHLKMELKRQQQKESVGSVAFSGLDQQQFQQPAQQQQQQVGTIVEKCGAVVSSRPIRAGGEDKNGSTEAAPRRVRGRRSSKPQMEKRRRARINQCLDILKSYVLGDSTNLSQLGIDTSARENQDEETIARTILKSSGLINRHRGRKNPNKLEKADILELTVDYVRRLHEQREELINQKQHTPNSVDGVNRGTKSLQPQAPRASMVPISSPLTLNLPAIDRAQLGLRSGATPPSPPPSSASSSPQLPLLSIQSNNNIQQQQQTPQSSPPVAPNNGPDVLDLSDCKRARVDNNQQQQPQFHSFSRPIYKDGVILIESSDGCWRPWNPNVML